MSDPHETLARIRARADARTTVPALVDALDAVLKVHTPMHCEPECCTEPVYCEGCKQPDDAPDWPCPTVKAITDEFTKAEATDAPNLNP